MPLLPPSLLAWLVAVLLSLLLPLLAPATALAATALTPAAALSQGSDGGMAANDRAPFQTSVDYTLTNQSDRDFSGQQLANSSFAGVVGRRASFNGANLHGAILTQAVFPQASFHGADLSDALMDRGDFSGADFSDALLIGAIASGSSFSGALVNGADFSDALLDRVDQRLLCREAEGINPVTGVSTRASLECG
jgi:uncharacterized protein YjbI with pentapeptide repeats